MNARSFYVIYAPKPFAVLQRVFITDTTSNVEMLSLKKVRSNGFKNNMGIAVYDASELIRELKHDIEKFGPDIKLLVITEERYGVKLYKDYHFDDGLVVVDSETDEGDMQTSTFGKLSESEIIEQITAKELLALYIEKNKPF